MDLHDSFGKTLKLCLPHFIYYQVWYKLEKAMATHSSVLAWRIPGMAEPGGLPSMGSHRVGHNWSDLAAAAAAALQYSCLENPMDGGAWKAAVHGVAKSRTKLSDFTFTSHFHALDQGTLKSLLQHHSSKASILLCSGFFTVQLSHPYMTTGKTHGRRSLEGCSPWGR